MDYLALAGTGSQNWGEASDRRELQLSKRFREERIEEDKVLKVMLLLRSIHRRKSKNDLGADLLERRFMKQPSVFPGNQNWHNGDV